MCLIVVGWQLHPDFPLVIAANRDEFHARPTDPLGRWSEAPQCIAGRDRQAGGTWMGFCEDGRFAAVTNYREASPAAAARSRGQLVADFLRAENTEPRTWVRQIEGSAYGGFNLFAGDQTTLYYTSNRGSSPRELPAGVHAVSNHLLGTPWPKLRRAQAAFMSALARLPEPDAFFTLLADVSVADDGELPATGVPLAWERMLSAVFVCSPSYGTRSSTLLLRNAQGQWRAEERSFDPAGRLLQSVTISTRV